MVALAAVLLFHLSHILLALLCMLKAAFSVEGRHTDLSKIEMVRAEEIALLRCLVGKDITPLCLHMCTGDVIHIALPVSDHLKVLHGSKRRERIHIDIGHQLFCGYSRMTGIPGRAKQSLLFSGYGKEKYRALWFRFGESLPNGQQGSHTAGIVHCAIVNAVSGA